MDTAGRAAILIPMNAARMAHVAGGRRLLASSGLALLCSLAVLPAGADAPPVRDSVVKIYAVHASPDYYMPWSTLSPDTSTSSGCIVPGNLVLTNAHAVADGTYLEVRRHGVAEKYPAQ